MGDPLSKEPLVRMLRGFGVGVYPGRVVEVENVVDGALVVDAGEPLGVELVLGPMPELGQVAGGGVDL